MSVRQLCLAQTTSCEVSDISSPRPEFALGLVPWYILLFLSDPQFTFPECQYQARCVQLGRLCTAHLRLVAKTEGEEI